MNGNESGGSGHVIGLDVGGTKVMGVLLDAQDQVVGSVRLPTVRGVDGVVTTVVNVVRSLTRDAGVALESVHGVGVGVPGLVDPTTGTVGHAVNLGLDGAGTPLARLLSEALSGVRVHPENDLNVAALGAAHLVGGGSDLAYLALGTGLGAGLLLNGRLRRGAFGAAGEIGHVTYVLDGLPCPCGQRGCLEQYASGSFLDVRWPTDGTRPAPVAVFAAAAGGDPGALALRDAFAAAVAAAVRALVLTTDVAVVVLGGGVSALGQPLLDAVVDALDRHAGGSDFLQAMRIGERLVLSPPGVPVGAVGAGLLVRGAGSV